MKTIAAALLTTIAAASAAFAIEPVPGSITYGGAKVMKLPNYGIEVGCRADLVLTEARVAAEAIVTLNAPHTVIKHGKVIVDAGECLF